MQDRGFYTVEKAAEVHNARSRAVMERLGMRHVGRILRPGFVAGSSEMHEDAPFALYRVGRLGREAPGDTTASKGQMLHVNFREPPQGEGRAAPACSLSLAYDWTTWPTSAHGAPKTPSSTA